MVILTARLSIASPAVVRRMPKTPPPPRPPTHTANTVFSVLQRRSAVREAYCNCIRYHGPDTPNTEMRDHRVVGDSGLGVLFFFASTFEHPGTRTRLGLELSSSNQKKNTGSQFRCGSGVKLECRSGAKCSGCRITDAQTHSECF
jgi:hypothetical protein